MYRKVFAKPLEDLTVEDVLGLVEREVLEGPYVDYKLDLGSKDGRKELARDVAAFANTHGGYLVLGMREDGGLPTEAVGLEIDDLEEFEQRIRNAIRDNTEPPVEHRLKFVKLADKGSRYVVVLEVPQSLNAPHMADGRFFRRAGNTNQRMHYLELRRAFAERGDVVRRIRDRFVQRVEDLERGYGPVDWSPSWPSVYLYVASIPAFDAGEARLFGPEDLKRINRLAHLFSGRPSTNYCADGLLAVERSNRGATFALLTPEGELFHGLGPVDEFMPSEHEGTGRPRIFARKLTRSMFDALVPNIPKLLDLGFDPPYYVGLAIARARGFMLLSHGESGHFGPRTALPIRHPFLLFDQLLLEEDLGDVLAVDTKESTHRFSRAAARLRPILDRLYQAAGASACPLAHALDGKDLNG